MKGRLCALVSLLGLLTLHPAAVAQSDPVLVGTVIKVTDGDTLKVQISSGPITVRFDSIDAPESNQPHGAQATAALGRLIGGREVQLDVVTQDRYDRLVAVVYVGDINVNERLVRDGHAWAYREYLKDRDYCRWEHDARLTGKGLWVLQAARRIAPWEWRRLRRGELRQASDYSRETAEGCIASIGEDWPVPAGARPLQTEAGESGPAGRCLIKGNISRSGKIYHLPSSSSYAATKIDESQGERWFCTEAEARAAGWRPPKG